MTVQRLVIVNRLPQAVHIQLQIRGSTGRLFIIVRSYAAYRQESNAGAQTHEIKPKETITLDVRKYRLRVPETQLEDPSQWSWIFGNGDVKPNFHWHHEWEPGTGELTFRLITAPN
jgi:hypothetical protein